MMSSIAKKSFNFKHEVLKNSEFWSISEIKLLTKSFLRIWQLWDWKDFFGFYCFRWKKNLKERTYLKLSFLFVLGLVNVFSLLELNMECEKEVIESCWWERMQEKNYLKTFFNNFWWFYFLLRWTFESVASLERRCTIDASVAYKQKQ
jgi:hypothetical protein